MRFLSRKLHTIKMSIAEAKPKYSFGIKGDVANNVWYLDEQNILYPSGANLIIFNVDQKFQKFIPCSAGEFHSMSGLPTLLHAAY